MEGGTGGVEGGFMQETLARLQPEMEHFALGLNCLNCTWHAGQISRCGRQVESFLGGGLEAWRPSPVWEERNQLPGGRERAETQLWTPNCILLSNSVDASQRAFT